MTARAPLPADTIRPKHLRPVPAAHQEEPLRGAGPRPRNLNEKRTEAREIERAIFQRALKAARISDEQLTSALGGAGDRLGAQVRAGASPITTAELTLLLPSVSAVGACILGLLQRRIDDELEASGLPSNDPTLTNLRLALAHVSALRVLLGASE